MIDFRKLFIAAAALALAAGLAEGQTPYLITTYAGGLPAPTSVQGTSLGISGATAVATDQFGNLYLATTSSCVFRLDLSFNVSRVAGTCQVGYSGDGGNAVNAQLNNPQGLAVDNLGNLYIADTGNQRIRRVAPSGVISTFAGTGTTGNAGDNGPATSAQLSTPRGIAVDKSGTLYIADQSNNRIRKVTANGTIMAEAGTGVGGSTGDGGPATSATLSSPFAVALDSSGDLFIGDGSYQVREVNPQGTILHFAGTSGINGSSGDNGPAASAQLSYPAALAVDSAGNVFIADEFNQLIRKVSVGGTITTFAGGGAALGDGVQATSGRLFQPVGLGVDYNENVYIADSSDRVRKVNSGAIMGTAVGTGNPPFLGDGGPASLAQFSGNWGLARDGGGNLYVADQSNFRVRKITPAGIISTFAGTGIGIDSGDGQQATASGVTPFVVATDSIGNVYLADNARVRKVALTGIVSTVAGTGVAGYSGDGGPATSAQLSAYVTGLALDSNFNVYIADSSNQVVRKVTPGGTISTFAGTGIETYSGDGGPATSAALNLPAGLVVDSQGNLYIADFNNLRVRKVTASGVISTYAGNGSSGNTGDGTAATTAKMTNPWGLALDGNGNLFIATQGNFIREVNSAGTIYTIAGTGTAGDGGDLGPATSALLNDPLSVAVDSAGNVYVSDYRNSAVRVLVPAGTEPLLSVTSTHAGFFAAGQTGVFTLNVSNAAGAAITAGTVTVTEILPPGLTLVSMTGSGWSCSANVCTNSNPLAAGASYPQPITVTVNVASGAPPQLTNQVTVSGGGSLPAGAEDAASIGSFNPALQISDSHSGNFVGGQTATYTIGVGNQPFAAATNSTVTVTDTLPAGLSLTSMAGTGWTCSANTCTRGDALAGGASYNPITVTVSVASNAPATVTNSATVSGGGSGSATATDITTIMANSCDLNADGATNVSDVQIIINEALGVAAANNDLNGDGVVNVADVQIEINAALGLGCVL